MFLFWKAQWICEVFFCPLAAPRARGLMGNERECKFSSFSLVHVVVTRSTGSGIAGWIDEPDGAFIDRSIDRCCRWPLCSAKDDGIDIDALAAEIEGAGASKETKGKKKKKGAKKEDFEYETTPPLSLYPPSLYLMLQKVHTINLILVMVIFVISHKLSLFSFLGEMWKRF